VAVVVVAQAQQPHPLDLAASLVVAAVVAVNQVRTPRAEAAEVASS
jgi:hypothetical protein